MAGSKKKIAIGLAVLGGVVLLAAITLVFFFPTDLIRERVVAAAERRLQRPVHVGDAHLTLFPAPGVELGDVWIGREAEVGSPRIALASARIGVRLTPLLRREVVITGVDIDRLEIEVVLPDTADVTNPGGSEGMNDPPATLPVTRASDSGAEPLSQTQAGEAGVRAQTSGRFHWRVDRLALREGRVLVRKRDGSAVFDLLGISEDLKAEVTRTGDLLLEGRSRIDRLAVHLPVGELGQGLSLDLMKRLRYLSEFDSLAIETADLDLGGLSVRVTGGVGAVTSKSPAMNLNLLGGPAEVADILGYLPSTMFPQMEGVRSSGTVAIVASVHGAPARGATGEAGLDYRCDLTLADGEVEHPKLPAAVEQIGLRATITPGFVDVLDFSASTGSSRIRARARVADYMANPSVDAALDADLDLQAVAGMRPVASGTKLSGRASVRVALQGPLNDANRLDVAGTVDLSEVDVTDPGIAYPIRDLNGRFLIRDKDVTIQEATGLLGASDFSARGTLANYRGLQEGEGSKGVARIEISLESRLLDLDELMPPPAKLRAMRAAAGKPPISPAEMTAASLAPLVGRIAFRADRIQSSRFEGRDAHGIAKIDRGLVTIEQLDLRAFEGKIAVQGTIDYRTPQAPRLALKTRIQKAQAARLLDAVESLDRFSRMRGLLTGEIDATATINGDLNDTLGLNLTTLKSTGDLSIQGAKISDHPVQVRIADFIDAPRLKNLALSDWFQPFRIENGRLVIDGLSLKGQQFEASASGWQSLSGEMELAIDLLLPQEFSNGIRKQIPKELIPVLFDGTGSRILLPVRVSGPSKAPRVVVDTERLSAEARAQAKARLAAERQRLEEEAKGRAQEFLKDVKGTVIDSTSIKQKAKEIEKELKGTLKDLFKKK